MQYGLSAGSILSETFSVFFRNIAAFGLICAIILSPSLIAQGVMVTQQFENPTEPSLWPIALLFLFALLTPIATGALTYGVFQHVRGRQTTVADCLSVGLKRLLPVLGVGILAGLIQAVGIMLCIIPGIYAATVLAAAIPAAVIERPGVVGSLSRSSDLTEGYRWTVFGVIFGLWVLQFAANMVVGVLGAVSLTLMLVATAISTILFTGLQATAPALVYYHLRRVKESIDADEIAAVFD